ncbi:SMI1/KNR4 family protein [Lysinibacillus sp. UGB7]|uniref:SMI1/KNR4 family protein n=1 Tax=Lysinibacillus sp. UGB7 TaxID=3411039 RepID=UPI003B7FB8B1
MKNTHQKIDAVIEKMQAAVEKMRVQDPQFYAKYPMHLMTDAEERALRNVSEKWRLPGEYLHFLKHYVPESVTWSTDEYINLNIYGAKDVSQGQWGYNYNPVTNEDILDWPNNYLVIATDEGDPYCIDLTRGDTVIYTAEHGMGTWDFSIAYDNLVEFLQSVLLPCGAEDWEVGEDVQYDYYKVFITGEGRDKIKTLMFIKKTLSCDYSQAKSYLEKVPLLVYKGIDLGAVKIETQLKCISAEYEILKIGMDEFLIDGTPIIETSNEGALTERKSTTTKLVDFSNG